MKSTIEETRLDLLCKQAVFGLTESETEQLRELEKNADLGADLESLELTAAMISMVGLEIEPMPAHLEAKIIGSFDPQISKAAGIAAKASAEENIFTRPRQPVADEPKAGSSLWDWFPWAVAAAACIALAVNVATDNSTPTVVQQPSQPQVEQKLTPAQERDQLLASARDVIKANWGPGNVKEIDQVGGEVVWSDEKQAGYMTLKGLPANDPNKETYQLWIFDETQDPETPIDGGVFDVNENGEVVIPIDAKLKAKNPSLFAVTIEKPGGVVRSKREKIAAAAKIEAPKTSA